MLTDNDRPTNDGQYPKTAKDLLQHYQYQKNRPLDSDEVLSAMKIAHITLTINNLGTDPSWAKGLTEYDYEELYKKSADELIKDIKRFPEKYPKALLIKIATEHFNKRLKYQ